MISLSGRVPGRASGPSRSRVDDGGGLQYVSLKSVLPFRIFATKRIYRRKGPHQGPTPPGGAAPYGAVASWLISVSPLDSVFVLGK
jgi:hypothetical protein